MSDELDGPTYFDDITPDHFAIVTSAVYEEEGRYTGADAFNLFADEGVRSVRVAFATGAGKLNPVAMLVSPTTRRHFSVEQDENLGMFLERLKREALLMGAHWLFIAKKNVFSIYHEEDDDAPRPDVASAEAKARALDQDEERVGILWYAERRENEVHHRHGAIEIVDNRLGDAREGDDKQTIGVFSLILDAVRR